MSEEEEDCTGGTEELLLLPGPMGPIEENGMKLEELALTEDTGVEEETGASLEDDSSSRPFALIISL